MSDVTGVIGKSDLPVSPTDPAWGKDRIISREKSAPLGTEPNIEGAPGMDAKIGAEQVERAAGDPKGNVVELIRSLKSPDRAVRARAAAALRRLDPPPTWALLGALFCSEDADFQVEIMKIMRRPGKRTRPASR